MSKFKCERSEGFCSRRCRSVEHADEITSAIIRGNEDQAIAFMCWRCSNYSRVTDEAGRTALHIASSCGKTKVMEWILKHLDSESFVNAKDYESGYTPLHRSLFYGQLSAARCLIKHGAKLTALDNDGLSPLDHLVKDKDFPTIQNFSSEVPFEVFVWGGNRNFNLGIGSNESRRCPDTVDYFRRNNVSISQVAMGKFHSIFLSSDGRVFSCGHGKGRLGLNIETIMTPKQITLPSNTAVGKVSDSRYAVVSASVGQDHTLLLTSKGIVYAFGLNDHYQLGLDPPPLIQHTPKRLQSFPIPVIGIKAARYHSVAWSTSEVYTWGSNHGQLGHERDRRWVITAKAVSHLRLGKSVAVSAGDRATVIGSSLGDIYVLQDYNCRKIGNIQCTPRRIEVIGGRLDPTLIKSEDVSGWGDYRSGEDDLYILILNNAKKLILWWSSTGHFTRCILHVGSRVIGATDFALGTDKLLVVTEQGEGFETDFKVRRKREDSSSSEYPGTTLQQLVRKDNCLDFHMKKIVFIHRAKAVFCCPKGINFSIVQFHPNFLTEKPKAERILGLEVVLRSLLEEADESDGICDIVFCVQDIRIPAHKYILESNSKYFASLFNSENKMQTSTRHQKSIQVNGNARPKNQSCLVVKIEDMNPFIFKEVLKYIYSGVCDICIPEMWSCERDSVYSQSVIHMKGLSRKVPPQVCDGDDEGNDVSECITLEETKGKCRHISGSDEYELNPVNDARRAAARFGLDTLVKQLDSLQYNKNKSSIQRKTNVLWSPDEKIHQKISLSPLNCPHLYDVVIECEGGKLISVHKCVLAMRSKYFETMFKGDWLECTGYKNITLPFSYEVVQAIISFLYLSKVPALNKSDDLSFIWNVLITSDQILLEGLKETCEILLANHISLKNVSEFYQISDIYNANKLKKCCLEFICNNLSALLECRALDDINSELFDGIQLRYWGTEPEGMSSIFTPSKYPDLSTLQSVFEVVGIPSEEEHFQHLEAALRKEAAEASKRNRPKRKQKSRVASMDEKAGNLSRLSLGSSSGVEGELSGERCDTSLTELEICKPFEEHVQISCQDESEKGMKHPTKEGSWVKYDCVPLEHSQSLKAVPEKNMNSVTDKDFPVLSSDIHQPASSASSKAPKNRKMTKLSQKERKKQLSSSLAAKQSVENGDTVSKPEVNPWGRLSTGIQEGSPVPVEFPSLLEIMDEERRRRPPVRRHHNDETTSDEYKSHWSAMRSLNMECPPRSPPSECARGGGWPTTPPSSEEQAMGPKPFNEIVADEIRQREMTKKMLEKPLHFTLVTVTLVFSQACILEDRAIKELQMSYDREHEHDERITVRRLTSAQAFKPVWCNSRNN